MVATQHIYTHQAADLTRDALLFCDNFAAFGDLTTSQTRLPVFTGASQV